LSEKDWFQKDFYILPLALSRSTDRSTVGRAKLLCRSIERSTNMHQSAFVHFGRPGGRPIARALLLVGSGRPPRSTDREFSSLVRNNGRPTGLSTAIPNGRRSIGRRIFFCIFPNGYILFCLFLGLFPTTLLSLLLVFSSPINSGTIKKSSNKISKV